VFATAVDRATLDRLHAAAHEGCFIANSVRTAVTVEARAE
jgi:organic hydroperoxide reductase OsmC/OhrA